MPQTFELIHAHAGKATIIIAGTAALCQWKRSQIKNSPDYKPGVLQVRRQGAYNYTLVRK